MITILTPIDHKSAVEAVIQSVDRLGELITVSVDHKKEDSLRTIYASKETISVSLDWYDLEPPYVFPPFSFSREHLLALVFFKLGNHQAAFEYLEEDTVIFNHLLIATNLRFGYRISPDMLSFIKNEAPENLAFVNYYGSLEQKPSYQELKETFSLATNSTNDPENEVFVGKQHLNLLLDGGELNQAHVLLASLKEKAISDMSQWALKRLECSLLMAGLEVPYQAAELEYLSQLQMNCIEDLKQKELSVQAAIMMMDAAETANYQRDFIMAKELINQAIRVFKEEDIPELLGEASLKKAQLLYAWSKNGSPQYYKAAINAFQDTLKVFKRDTHPQQFADIHHSMAMIYSEIMVSEDEKPIWMAFCASSFKEVLDFYRKEKYPYEYAMASHNYGTALMSFPPAKIHDNHAKANELFNEALLIRTARSYPLERTLTILNQLELHWMTHNEDEASEWQKYEEMRDKAEEVKTLTDDANLIAKAEEHLRALENLKTLI